MLMKQLFVAPKQLFLASEQLFVASEQLFLASEQLFVASKQLFVAYEAAFSYSQILAGRANNGICSLLSARGITAKSQTKAFAPNTNTKAQRECCNFKVLPILCAFAHAYGCRVHVLLT